MVKESFFIYATSKKTARRHSSVGQSGAAPFHLPLPGVLCVTEASVVGGKRWYVKCSDKICDSLRV